MFQGEKDDMDKDMMCKASNIQLEPVSKSHFGDEDVNYSNNINWVKKEIGVAHISERDLFDSNKCHFIKKEKGIHQDVKIKIEPKIEVPCDSYYDVGSALVKKEKADSTRSYNSESETDNEEKKWSPLEAATLRHGKQSTPTDMLMDLKKNNFGLLNCTFILNVARLHTGSLINLRITVDLSNI